MIHRLTLLICLLSPLSAWAACEGKEQLFVEDFSEPDPTWAPGSQDWYTATIQDKKYVVSLKSDHYYQDFPTSFVFSGDYKVCITMTLPDEPTVGSGSGLVFWVSPKKDADGNFDFYRALISPDGFFWVSRSVNGQSAPVVPAKPDDSLKVAKGKPYEIELTITGNSASLAINGKQLTKFKGQPPPNSYAGFAASSPDDYNGDWKVEFTNFRVVK